MAPFKDELGAEAARRLAGELTRAWRDFPARRFMWGLGKALGPLELLARGAAITDRLIVSMPASLRDAEFVLRAALDSPTFSGWIVLPCGGFIAGAGIDDPDRSLPLLADLTSRWSSEFAIRPFIMRHPKITQPSTWHCNYSQPWRPTPALSGTRAPSRSMPRLSSAPTDDTTLTGHGHNSV